MRRVPGRALTAHLERWIGLDPRSLALLRIGLGLAVAADAWIRSGDVVAHYADAGIVSRRDVLDEFAFLHRWAVSLHLAGGSAPFEAVLLGFAGLAGLALALGYRTRVAVLAAWFLTSSVQLRNLYIGAGYDALLRMLLLWGCFLPLGAAASIDALGRPGAEARRPHVSVAGLGLILQMAFVFGVAGYAKWLEPAWRSGTAVADIFADEMRAGRLAELLGGQASLLGAATYAVPWVEMVGAILFLSPVANGRLRAVAVLALALSVAAFGATLEVGLFPLVALAGLAGLLPRWFWEGPARRAGDALAGRRSASPAADGERRRVGRGLAGALSSALVAYVAFWNVGVARDPSFRAPRAVAWFGETLFLQQAWRMFAHPASRTGWLVMEGHLRDGRSADLFADGGRMPSLELAIRPIAWERPPVPAAHFASDRWRVFFERAVRGTGTERRLNLYGRFVCREWNRARDRREDELLGFELWWIAAPLEPRPRVGEHVPQLIWRHHCFG